MSPPICYDISHYESPVSFHDAYNAGYILAICKACHGTHEDTKFASFMQRLHTIDGQLTGAYGYAVNAEDANSQAEALLRIAAKEPLLCVDFERTLPKYGGSPTLQQGEAYVSRVHKDRGKWPLLYCGEYLKGMTVPNSSPLRQCEVWVSQYGPKVVTPTGWSSARLWQFTGDGKGPMPHDVPGVGVNVDQSKFSGTVDDLRRWYASLTP